MALTQPVAVTRNGCERTVMISAEEYPRLKRRDRRVLDDDAAVAALRGRIDDRTFDLIFINAGIFPPECATRHMLAGRGCRGVPDQRSGTAIRVARAFPGRVRDGRGIIALMSTGLGSVADVTDSSSDL
jgi:hypothetical protein